MRLQPTPSPRHPARLHLDIGGPTRVLRVDGARYWFEMHPQAGPLPSNAAGVLRNGPGPRHRFWSAVSLWAQQGQRLDDDGLCLWDEAPTPILTHVAGRHYRVDGMHPLVRGS